MKNEEYRGTHPFSEPETRFVRDVAIKWKIDAYMSMHTGAQVLLSAFLSRRVYMSVGGLCKPPVAVSLHLRLHPQQLSIYIYM